MNDGVNIFVAGQTGAGKSYALKRWIQADRRLFVYQAKREDVDYPGVYFDGLADEWQSLCAWWEWVNRRCRAWRIVYRPRNKWDAEEFDRVCRLVYLVSDCTFVAEEIQSYLTSRIFETKDRYQAIKSLLTDGRTRGIRAYWVTQRPFGIPRHVTSEARDAYLFRLQEPADKDYVQDRFGIEARLKLDLLEEYQYVHWINTGKMEVGKA